MSGDKMERVYLDYAATTPVREEVLAVLAHYNNAFYNPSSIYRNAQQIKNAIEASRKKVAELLNVKPSEIYFTSGGTESNNWALIGVFAAYNGLKNKLITSEYEHHSILKTAEFIEYLNGEVKYINIMPDGRVDINRLNNIIDDNTFLVSIMYANNELGSVNDVDEIADICHSKNVLFHTDAVAAAPHIKINAEKFDLLTISAHKFYGPKGAGILYIRNGAKIQPLLNGGEQENGMRAGTENAAAIIGCALALELNYKEIESENSRLSYLKSYFIDKLKSNIPQIIINNNYSNCLPNYINISLPDIAAQEALIALDLKGIECSNGSACMAGGSNLSHVLKSLTLPDEQIRNSLRITMGKDTTITQIDYTIEALKKVCDAS